MTASWLAILAPVAKWGAILALVVFGIWAFAKHFKKDGGQNEVIKQLERGDEAQQRQAKAQRAQHTRDLLDELKRVRNRKGRGRTTPTLHDEG